VHPDPDAERKALLDDLLAMQEQMETALVPEMVEPVLSMRLTMPQLKVLTILTTSGAEEGSAMAELARTAGVSVPTMSGVVDRLESQGMVERVVDSRDHRVRRVIATAAGRDTIQKLAAARPQMTRAPLEKIALEDLRALSQGMAAVLRAVREG
jgi:DNA-binding MarR family transcriptional regulator